MKRIENDCVGCELPCIGDACPYHNVPHYYCDKCGEEDTLYEFDDQELCIDCIKDQLSVVEGSEL
jgi:hypothetical protein